MQLAPEDRHPTAQDFVRAIRPRLSTDSIFVPDTLPAFEVTRDESEPHTGPSVAVLPFTNLSADPDNEFFSDGIIEDIITQLSNVESLKVTSRTSVAQYKGSEKTLRQIGSELGVKNVLEGSVRRAGNRVRVSAQLIDVATDSHIWAERFDRELTDIFGIQDEIAARITSALEMRLTSGGQERVNRRRTENIDAYTLYLQGRSQWERFTPTGIQRSIAFYEDAIALDPEYAMPHTGLAASYSTLTATLGLLSPHEGMPKTRQHAERAISLDPELGEAHASLASVYDSYDWDWAAADTSLQQAMTLEPESVIALVTYAFHLSALQKHDDALRVGGELETLCPASAMVMGVIGFLNYEARHFEKALSQIERARKVDPLFPPLHTMTCWINLILGRHKQAIASARKSAELTDYAPPRRAALGCALSAGGQTEEAEAIYDGLLDCREKQYVSALDLALLATYLVRPDAAFEWLEVAVDERATWMNHLHADPVWDPIREDPRFSRITRRVGLPTS
jgi:TolB-like protein/tetratricopeptide (TPR) repeat protein